MSSIIRRGDTYHGISVAGRGVFTDDKHGDTYAGQCKDGHACGLGVLTCSNGTKEYAEHGPDGKSDGRHLDRNADGHTYFLYDRGKRKEYGYVYADGTYCMYNYVSCAPDDPRLLALIALVAPVEVRPDAPSPPPAIRPPLAPKPSSDGSAGSFCQALAAAVATEVHPNAARRRWWPCDTTQQQQKHGHAVARVRAGLT
jgi:hypothetical protein